MPPKKEKAQKLTLGEFMSNEQFGGSWADEVEETFESGTQPLPLPERRGYGGGGGSYGGGMSGGYGADRGAYSYRERDTYPQTIPDKPPYTAHLGNLSYDATQESVTDFFADCEVTSVRIVEDREQGRPKGFGYAEFRTPTGLEKALTLDGTSFQGRNIRIRIADPPKDRGDGPMKDMSDWTRKGPLPDLPGRGGDRGGDRGMGSERRGPPSEFGERRPPREPAAEPRNLDWGARKGPLSPLPQAERPSMSRDGSRPRGAGGVPMDERSESFRGARRNSPAWGEGQPPRQEGSRPPRKEFTERPERVPSAAEKDMQWRSNMRPDGPPAGKSPHESRSGSEAPSSPAPAAAVPASRPKLNLAKRTVSEAPDVLSPGLSSAGGESKASPFGAARPIDTAARERAVEEKRQQALKEKKEQDDKAKEEKRLAKEAAAEEAATKAAEDATEETENKDAPAAEEASKDTKTEPAQNGAGAEEKGYPRTREPRERQPREPREGAPSRATEGGSWRQASGDMRTRGAPSGPRGGRGAPRGGPRGEGRGGSRANGAQQAQQPRAAAPSEPESPTVDEDGWTTVKSVPRRGGRPVA